MLYRRTCVLLEDIRESGVTMSMGAERPTHFLCTHGLDVGDDEDAGRWAERSFEEKAQVSPYFVVHGASHERAIVRCADSSVCAEFMFPAVSLYSTFREVVDKPFVSEVRQWVLYKAFPSRGQCKMMSLRVN